MTAIPRHDAMRAAGHDPVYQRPARRVVCTRCAFELTDTFQYDPLDDAIDPELLPRCSEAA